MAGTARSYFQNPANPILDDIMLNINNVVWDLSQLREGFSEVQAQAAWDPASIAAGAAEEKDVTATGAALGDYAQASMSIDLAGLQITAYVSATDTITAVLHNPTASPIDLGSGTLRVRSGRQTAANTSNDMTAFNMTFA
jgi:hypothetical protein